MTVTMEAMYDILARMTKDAAKSTGFEKLGDHINRREVKIDTVEAEVNGHSAQLNNFRSGVDLLKTRGSTSGATAMPSSADTGWRPRLAHVRGWAPRGSRASQKLTRKESSDLQNQVAEPIPQEWAHKTRLLAPFMLPHALSIEALGAKPFEADRVTDKLDLSLATSRLTIKDSQVRAAAGDLGGAQKAATDMVLQQRHLCGTQQRQHHELREGFKDLRQAMLPEGGLQQPSDVRLGRPPQASSAP